MRMGRKGARTNDLRNYLHNYPKTQWLKSPNISLCFAILWVRNLRQASSAPRVIGGGHFGAIQSASGLTGEPRTDIICWHV